MLFSKNQISTNLTWNCRGKDHKTKEHSFLIIPVQKLSKSIEKPWRNLRKRISLILTDSKKTEIAKP